MLTPPPSSTLSPTVRIAFVLMVVSQAAVSTASFPWQQPMCYRNSTEISIYQERLVDSGPNAGPLASIPFNFEYAVRIDSYLYALQDCYFSRLDVATRQVEQLAGGGAGGCSFTPNPIGSLAAVAYGPVVHDGRDHVYVRHAASDATVFNHDMHALFRIQTSAPYGLELVAGLQGTSGCANAAIGSNARFNTLGGIAFATSRNTLYAGVVGCRYVVGIHGTSPFAVSPFVGDGTTDPLAPGYGGGYGTNAPLGGVTGMSITPNEAFLYAYSSYWGRLYRIDLETSFVVAVAGDGADSVNRVGPALSTSMVPDRGGLVLLALNDDLVVFPRDQRLYGYVAHEGMIMALAGNGVIPPQNVPVPGVGDAASFTNLLCARDSNTLMYCYAGRALLTVEVPTPCVMVVGNCACSKALSVDYDTSVTPDAVQHATTSMVVDAATGDVSFLVDDVYHLYHGHVLVGDVTSRDQVNTAFPPLVESYDPTALWNSSNCTLGSMERPPASAGVTVERKGDCSRRYVMTFSLVNPAARSPRCSMTVVGGNITVGCNVTLTSTRAYDLSSPQLFLGFAVTLAGSIVIPTSLSAISQQVFALLAKCSVQKAALDCRITGDWTLSSTVLVEQSIDQWIDAASCGVSKQGGDTFVRCNLNPITVSSNTHADANLTVFVGANEEPATFAIDGALPYALTVASSSAELSGFVHEMRVEGQKSYYGAGEHLTIVIRVVDTSLVSVTGIEFSNSAVPPVSYDLRTNNRFRLEESTTNATHLTIRFTPSGAMGNSQFYRYGPHSVNVTFSIAPARRQATRPTGGWMALSGVEVVGVEGGNEGPVGAEGRSSTGAAAAAGADSKLVAIIAAAAVFACVVTGFVVYRVAKRNGRGDDADGDAAPAATAAEGKTCDPSSGCELGEVAGGSAVAIAMEADANTEACGCRPSSTGARTTRVAWES